MVKGSLGRAVRGRWVTALVCASVLAATTPAASQDDTDELARRHFEAGAAYLQASDYESSLREFQRSYDLSKRAEILLNIATVHERAGQLEEAIAALEQYLAEDPEGEHVGTAKLRIENLHKRQQTEAADAGAPPPQPVAEADAEVAESADAGAAPAQPEAAAPVDVQPEPLPPPEPESEANLPAYVLLGIGGVAAVAAGVTGYLANNEFRDNREACSPHCTDDELSTGRTMAWTSTILTGVAVLGVGVGATLLLLAEPEPETPPTTASAQPKLDLGVGPGGAAASATWRF